MKTMTKSELLRTRCDQTFKNNLELFATAKGLEMSDIVRIACTEMMQRHGFFSGVFTQPNTPRGT